MHHRLVACFAVATLTSIGVWVVPVGAASNVSCRTSSGSATFAPALPKSGDAHTVHAVLSLSGKLGGCSGGVTSGVAKFKSTKSSSGMNCKTWLTYNARAMGTTGTATIKWNTGQTSTVHMTLRQVKGQPTRRGLSGPVTAGPFRGYQFFGTVAFTLPKSACKTTALSTMTYKQVVATSLQAPRLPPP